MTIFDNILGGFSENDETSSPKENKVKPRFEPTSNIDNIAFDVDKACNALQSLKTIMGDLSTTGSSLGSVDFSRVPKVDGSRVSGSTGCLSSSLGTSDSSCILDQVFSNIYNGINRSFNQEYGAKYGVDFDVPAAFFNMREFALKNGQYEEMNETNKADFFRGDGAVGYYRTLLGLDGSEITDIRENESGIKEFTILKDGTQTTITVNNGKIVEIGSNGQKFFYDDGDAYATLFDKNGIHVDFSEDDIICTKYDAETGKYSPIKYSDENPKGISYTDNGFKTTALMDNASVMAELKKEYPASAFNSKEEAEKFYEDYLNGLSCSYADPSYVKASSIMDSFVGKERDFEDEYGCSPYTVDLDGNLKFNDEVVVVRDYYGNSKKYYTVIDGMEDAGIIEESEIARINGKPTLDGLSEKAKEKMKELSETWPMNLSPDRLKIMNIAFQYYGKDYVYGDSRTYNDPKKEEKWASYRYDNNGNVRVDCSQFVTEVAKAFADYKGATTTLDPNATNTAAYSGEHEYLIYKEIDELLPGDIVISYDNDKKGGTGNHVLIFCGYDDNPEKQGTKLFIDSTNSGEADYDGSRKLSGPGIRTANNSKRNFFSNSSIKPTAKQFTFVEDTLGDPVYRDDIIR